MANLLWELGRGGMSIYSEASSQPRGDGGGGSVNPSGARRGVPHGVRLNYPCAFCESLKEYCLLVVLWRSNMWARSYKVVPKVCAYGELNIGEFYIANRIPQVGSESNSHSNIMVISGYWFTFDCIMFSIFLDPLKQSKTPGLRITYVQKYPTCTDNGGDNRSNSYSLVALLNLVCWGKK